MAVVAELYRVPPRRTDWARDADGLVAITAKIGPDSPPLTILERGGGYVACRYGETIWNLYFSPNKGLFDFEEFLEVVGTAVSRYLPERVLVAGDPNAKLAEWGFLVTDARRELLGEWAAELDLRFLNGGSTHAADRGSHRRDAGLPVDCARDVRLEGGGCGDPFRPQIHLLGGLRTS